MTDETTTAQGTTASPATEPENKRSPEALELERREHERGVRERERSDADELAAYRRRDAEQAESDRATAERNAAQHEPLPPVPAGVSTDTDADAA